MKEVLERTSIDGVRFEVLVSRLVLEALVANTVGEVVGEVWQKLEPL